MRTPLLLIVLALTGCTAQEKCRSLGVGMSANGLEKNEIPKNSFVLTTLISPTTSAPFGRGTEFIWDKGPAEEAMCCATQEAGEARAWCTEEQLQCTDPSMKGVKLYWLAEPFSDESRIPDDATYCFIAVHENRIIAIWHRYWS
ncbi:MAG: hypothetical protein JNM17_17700 [Archangium sp.]|nr:hypothetical protein [Archangium sp.]